MAAPNPSASRRALLAQIHLGKKELGLDDDTYRGLLRYVTGQESAGALSISELERVCIRMRQLGWQNRGPSRRFRASEKPHVRKVWALWGAMKRQRLIVNATKEALRTFVERMTKVSDPEWLTPEQAIQVIEGIKAWKLRLEQKGNQSHDREVGSDS